MSQLEKLKFTQVISGICPPIADAIMRSVSSDEGLGCGVAHEISLVLSKDVRRGQDDCNQLDVGHSD